jgi:spermidine/putrescine transport system permease protein
MTGNLIEQQFLSTRNWTVGLGVSRVVMVAMLALLLVQLRLARREALS